VLCACPGICVLASPHNSLSVLDSPPARSFLCPRAGPHVVWNLLLRIIVETRLRVGDGVQVARRCMVDHSPVGLGVPCDSPLPATEPYQETTRGDSRCHLVRKRGVRILYTDICMGQLTCLPRVQEGIAGI